MKPLEYPYSIIRIACFALIYITLSFSQGKATSYTGRSDYLQQKVEFVSSNDKYKVVIDPTHRRGVGACYLSLYKEDILAWKERLPYTIYECVVSNDGYIIGYGYTMRKQGWKSDPGELVIFSINPTGDKAFEERFPRHEYKSVPSPISRKPQINNERGQALFEILSYKDGKADDSIVVVNYRDGEVKTRLPVPGLTDLKGEKMDKAILAGDLVWVQLLGEDAHDLFGLNKSPDGGRIFSKHHIHILMTLDGEELWRLYKHYPDLELGLTFFPEVKTNSPNSFQIKSKDGTLFALTVNQSEDGSWKVEEEKLDKSQVTKADKNSMTASKEKEKEKPAFDIEGFLSNYPVVNIQSTQGFNLKRRDHTPISQQPETTLVDSHGAIYTLDVHYNVTVYHPDGTIKYEHRFEEMNLEVGVNENVTLLVDDRSTVHLLIALIQESIYLQERDNNLKGTQLRLVTLESERSDYDVQSIIVNDRRDAIISYNSKNVFPFLIDYTLFKKNFTEIKYIDIPSGYGVHSIQKDGNGYWLDRSRFSRVNDPKSVILFNNPYIHQKDEEKFLYSLVNLEEKSVTPIHLSGELVDYSTPILHDGKMVYLQVQDYVFATDLEGNVLCRLKVNGEEFLKLGSAHLTKGRSELWFINEDRNVTCIKLPDLHQQVEELNSE